MSKTTNDIAERTPKGTKAECHPNFKIPELCAYYCRQGDRNSDPDGP